jgi:hypothetical protein
MPGFRAGAKARRGFQKKRFKVTYQQNGNYATSRLRASVTQKTIFQPVSGSIKPYTISEKIPARDFAELTARRSFIDQAQQPGDPLGCQAPETIFVPGLLEAGFGQIQERHDGDNLRIAGFHRCL